MSVITASNNTEFKDSAIVINNVKRFLKSYDGFDLLNEEEFYRYIDDIINQLGLGVLMEDDYFINIESSRGELPYNFRTLYAAYSTKASFSHKGVDREQGTGFSITRDVTQELITKSNRCNVDCCEDSQKIIQKLTIRNFVNEGTDLTFTEPVLLTLSPNVNKKFVDGDCMNVGSSSKSEITIDGRYIYTNFDEGIIYMKYYGFPVNKDTGLPMIPNIKSVEKAIEWYIIYQSLLGMWFNSTVPDIQNKFKEAEVQYQFWFAQALHERKLPTFETLIEQTRIQRKSLNRYKID